ncbi:MAG: hypothetical protein GX211_05770 [Clostridiaceae bacterium]|nr:hypothetical protein [Clostridiaceae bacterium]
MERKRISRKNNLRKLVTGTLILIFCVTALHGCKNNQVHTPTDSKQTDVPTGILTDTATDNTTDNKLDSSVIKDYTLSNSENTNLKELTFIYNDNIVGISDLVDDEKLESILGEAEEIKSHTYSYDDGLNMDMLVGFTEKQYKYPGLEIKTINTYKDEKFFIFQIKITDSSYSTIRDIKVGDSVKKLKEAYPEGNLLGNGTANEEGDFQYLTANYDEGIKFHIKNELIESILMYKLLD